MAAGRDDEILFVGGRRTVSHRRSVAAGGKLCFPQLLPGIGVEAAKETIRRTGDENKPAGSDDGSAEADGARRNLLGMRAAKILHRAERDLPAYLSFRHVHRGEHSPGWRAARKIGRRLDKSAIEAVRRPQLVAVIPVLGGARVAIVIFFTGNQAGDGDEMIDIGHEDAALGVEGVPAPGHPAEVAWNHERAFEAGRCENPFVAKVREVIAAPVAVFGSRPPGLVGGKSLRSERRRLYRERLCRRSDFAGNVGLRDGTLLDREDGLARVAAEDVEESGLVALNDDGDVFAVNVQCGEQRRGGTVKVPQIVMNELKAPDELAGFATQGDHGVGPLVVARAKAAVVVGTGTPGRDKEQVARGIHGHDGPGVAAATAPGAVLAFRCRSGGIRGKRIPAPAESAGAGIIGTHDATGHVLAMVVVDRGADDYEIVDDGRRGSHVVPAWVVLEHVTEADLTGFAQVAAGCAGRGVHGDEAGVLRGLEDAAPARLLG